MRATALLRLLFDIVAVAASVDMGARSACHRCIRVNVGLGGERGRVFLLPSVLY